MWKLLQALKARTVTTALVVVATLLLAVWSAGHSPVFAGTPFDGGTAQQILPGTGSLQVAGSGVREFTARQRMEAFRLSGHPQSSPENDPPFDFAWRSIPAPTAKTSPAPSFVQRALAPSAYASPYDPRGPPAV